VNKVLKKSLFKDLGKNILNKYYSFPLFAKKDVLKKSNKLVFINFLFI
jgi:hypothetical protein